MDDSQRLKLQEMISVNDTKDHTNEIRALKHSKKIRADVNKIVEHKLRLQKNLNGSSSLDDSSIFEKVKEAAQQDCFFLFQNYTSLFHKCCRGDLDMHILYQFLDVLETVEEGEVDQHEASYTIGLLLKKLYVDKKLEELTPVIKKMPQQLISWAEYAIQNKLI